MEDLMKYKYNAYFMQNTCRLQFFLYLCNVFFMVLDY